MAAMQIAGETQLRYIVVYEEFVQNHEIVMQDNQKT